MLAARANEVSWANRPWGRIAVGFHFAPCWRPRGLHPCYTRNSVAGCRFAHRRTRGAPTHINTARKEIPDSCAGAVTTLLVEGPPKRKGRNVNHSIPYPFPYLMANSHLKPTRAALPVEGGQGRCHHCARSIIWTSHASWGPLGARLGPHDRALSCHNHPPSTLR